MSQDNQQYFYCYDRELFDYLNTKGFRFITKARHFKTNALFTLFQQTLELNLALEEWKVKNLNFYSQNDELNH